jgi:hypothetical protein
MQATILQPASPIPQPTGNQPFSEAFERRLREWEGPTEPTQPSVPQVEVTNSSTGQTMPVAAGDPGNSGSQILPSNLLQEIPIRPPPPTPVTSDGQEHLDLQSTSKPTRRDTAPVNRSPAQEPPAMSRRSETAPVGHTPEPNGPTSPGVALPSADQLSRLNSRKGRPRGLSDPRRVSVGSSPQLRPSGGSHNRVPSGGSISNTPPQLSLEPGWNGPQRLTPDQAFRTSQISYPGSPQRSPDHLPSNRHFSSSPSRRISNGNSHKRNGSNGSRSPNLRPPMHRLETIHSQSSTGPEPSPYFAHKAMILGRQPSRAERSAAKNIKDAKKKGWRSSMQRGDKKLKKDRMGDGASSAGWTDMSRDSAHGHKQSARGKGDEKGSKCAVM